MRIAYIAAGAGALHCGACQRDAALFRSLTSAGQDLLAVPIYTPLLTETPLTTRVSSVFLGGINLYLNQAIGLFARLPQRLRRQLDRPGLLRQAARFGLQTDPKALGPMTVGMLRGMDGPHALDIQRLIDYLQERHRPQILHLSNSLLVSLAPAMKAAFAAPVVCTLQGEEAFLDGLPEPFRAEAMSLWRKHAESVDRFVACSRQGVEPLADALRMATERFCTIPTGIDADVFARRAGRETSAGGRTWRLGYLSSIRPEKGLDLLIESLRLLVNEAGADVQLHVAGRVLDRAYWAQVRRKIAQAGLGTRVTYRGVPDLPGKIAFLQGCDVFVMPTRLAEARAVAAMEALAAGVPVVATRRGVLPELLGATGGGIVVEPEDPAALARGVHELLQDPRRRMGMSQAGPAGIATHYAPERMARQTIELYEQLLGEQRDPPGASRRP